MAWPLTGSALTKYNRLLSDLRQYGDFIFVGAPDDITWLQETIVAASDGALRPSLDDVANRSHYWMLELSRVLGEKVVEPTPCPECPPVVPCPPCPPCPPPPDPTGLNWETDETAISFFADPSGTAGFPYNDPTLTSLTFHSLVNIAVVLNLSVGFPGLQHFNAPNLETVGEFVDLTLTSLAEADFPALSSVGFNINLVDIDTLVYVDFPALVSVGLLQLNSDFRFENCAILETVSAPLLETVSGGVYGFNCPLLNSVNLDSLTGVGTDLDFSNCDSLVSLSCPALVTSGSGGSGIFAGGSLVLTDLNFPSYLPPNTAAVDFSNCALTAASVNHILARGVANAAFVSGQVDLDGGTSSAPTGQGIADKATLIGRGVTVNTN